MAELEEQGSVRALAEFDVLSDYSSSLWTLRTRSEKAAKSFCGICRGSNLAVQHLGQMTSSRSHGWRYACFRTVETLSTRI